MALPENPITRQEMFLNGIATGESENLPEPITREEQYLDYIAKNGGGGGGGGTTNYNQLSNKPKINNVELSGNKSLNDLGIQAKMTVDSALSGTSENPVQNKVVKTAIDAKADLVNGKIPSNQLPSFVDDVINGYLYEGRWYSDAEHQHEIEGENDKIYVEVLENKTYRWSGIAFIEISESLALGETSATAYRGDRGKTAYDFSQNPATETPKMNGTGAVGTSGKWAREDHVHPSDTSKANVGDSPVTFTGTQAQWAAEPNKSKYQIVNITDDYEGGGGGGSDSHTYSTTEHVVGTWIDGKPLYERTIAVTTPNTTAETNVSIAELGFTNIDKIFMASPSYIYLYINNKNQYVPITLGWGANGAIGIIPSTDASHNGYLIWNVAVNEWISKDGYVTLRYTKTTD